MRIIITGATGYIGERLASQAFHRGYHIISATRRPPRPEYEWLPYGLTDPKFEYLGSVHAIIHLAADTASNNECSAVQEVQAARNLISSAKGSAAKLIFISSQTASVTAPTSYGRTKWIIEQEVLAYGGVVLRPGQVYGGPERGLFGKLTAFVRRSPIFPFFLPSPFVQPIHIDDLVASILEVLERDDIHSETFCLGSIKPISFGRFLRSIALYRLNTIRVPLPFPVALIRLASLALGERRFTRLGLDRIFSLISLQPMQTDQSFQRLRTQLRPLIYGMHRSGNGRRRQLLVEANAFLRYILKSQPSQKLSRCYVRAIEGTGNGEAIIRSGVLTFFPVTITLLDNKWRSSQHYQAELTRRLYIATVLAEASPQGAAVFLGGQKRRNLFFVLVGLGLTILKDLCWGVLALLFQPITSHLIKKRNSHDDV